MPIIKLIHLTSLFIWIGSLIYTTKLMANLSLEEDSIQEKGLIFLRKNYFSMHLPAFIIAIISGLALLKFTTFGPKLGWFHSKMTFSSLLILLDIYVMLSRMRLEKEFKQKNNPLKYKLQHVAVILLLVGVLSTIYLMRNKEKEIIDRAHFSQNKTEKLTFLQNDTPTKNFYNKALGKKSSKQV